MGFGTLEQLIAKGRPSALQNAMQGFQRGATMMPNIKMAQLAPLLRQAQIASEKAKASALPFQAAGSYLGGLGKLGQTRLSANPSYILARMVNSPALLAMASKDPKFAKNLMVTMQTLGQQSSQQGLPGQDNTQMALSVLNSAANQHDSPDRQGTYNQLMAPVHHAPPQINQDNSAILQHAQNTSPSNDQDVAAFQQALGDAFLKKTTTANIMNQRQYVGILDNLFNTSTPLMPSVAKYAGFKGKTQKGLDAFESAAGTSSPDYQNYLKFTRTIAPLVANEMRRSLGGQASDKEVAAMDAIVNPAFWDSNPTAAMNQWKFLTSTYRGSINPALMANPSRVVNRFGSSKPFVSRAQEAAPTQAVKTTAGLIKASDGQSYSREELQRIAAGGK